MGEHKLKPYGALKAKWEAQKSVGTHHRYIWRSSEKGAFRYPKELYGALKSRREFKRVRKWIKDRGFRGPERVELMLNISGIDE